MKANELRIGNWINEFGIAKQVMPNDILGLYQIVQAGKICIDLTPIPLTEEWLLKFGFYRTFEYDDFDAEYENELRDQITLKNGIYSFHWPSLYVGSIEIQYVHQFQNLYFALCGNELTIKL